MGRYRVWWMAGAVALGAWGAYALVSRHVRVVDTAAQAAALLPAKEAFARMPPDGRKAVMLRLSEAVSGLGFDERHALQHDPRAQAFVESLTEEERIWYARQVMPRRMREELERFSKLPAGERARIVGDAIEELRRQGKRLSEEEEGRVRAELSSPETTEAYRTLMRSYLSEMTPQQKSELAPFVREVATQYQQASERAGGR